MSDIELVIKIPEDVLKRTVFYREFKDLNDCITTIKALEKAILLPKGHGRLIDENDLKTLYRLDDRLWWGNAVEEFTDLPTIIEADKEDEE